jgi:dimethylglycine catabolism A
VNALYSPVFVGGVEVPNRIVMPPMTTRLAGPDGYVTDALVAYYKARALGGVGLITVEMGSPEKVGRHRFRELGVYDDRFLPGLERLVGVLHDSGARVSVQLGHGGSRARKAVSGETPIAPSSVPTPVYEVEAETVVPSEMSKARIQRTIQAFVDAARRMQRAGFDFVELHGAHGYLISRFLSPKENISTDEYGGPLENRARFGLDVLRSIKREVPSLPVVFRLGVEDFFPGGLTFAEGLQVVQSPCILVGARMGIWITATAPQVSNPPGMHGEKGRRREAHSTVLLPRYVGPNRAQRKRVIGLRGAGIRRLRHPVR